MPKYVVLYTAPVSAEAQMEANDPEMGAEVMKAWNAWSERVGENMVDLGMPLGNGRRVTSSGTSGSDSAVAGYSILQADDIDAAVNLLSGHPHLQIPGAAIEVHETLSLPGGM
ncbi:MAG TPA: hypothetical protein VJR05_03005 [Acidimicrobiia bacterium]|nr:hypothetical protein [Acidimicrobiia bacterium]